jgi:hypothetical protein
MVHPRITRLYRAGAPWIIFDSHVDIGDGVQGGFFFMKKALGIQLSRKS